MGRALLSVLLALTGAAGDAARPRLPTRAQSLMLREGRLTMIALKRILVATDFGSAAETALAYGRALATRFGADLHLLHVTTNVYASVGMAYEYTSVPPGLQHEVDQRARTQLDALLSDEDRKVLHATAAVTTHSSPAIPIVEYASTHKVDLIILGTHGRGALAHAFMGSVAERVVRMAPCPVLTVRHPEHEFVLPDSLVATSATPA